MLRTRNVRSRSGASPASIDQLQKPVVISGMPGPNPLTILHSQAPLRVWSLIVTIFGDVVMDRGRDHHPAPVWSSDLMALLALLGIDAGHARTNLSRLVANGTLQRGKDGRRTDYRLSTASAADFARAAAVIYGADTHQPAGDMILAALDLCADRKAARLALEADGFRFLSSTLAMASRHERVPDMKLTNEVVFAVATSTPALRTAVNKLWHLDDLNHAYRRFVTAFDPVTGALEPEEAVILRIVVTHMFRRLVLRDPLLPAAMLPADWQGSAARAVFMRQIKRTARSSDVWFSRHGFHTPTS